MKAKIFFKTYIIEIATLIIDAVLVLLSFILTNSTTASFISLLLLIVSTIIFIFLKMKDKDFYYCAFDKPADSIKWIGRGDLRYISNEKCFEITNSDVGFISPKVLDWDNYKFEFEFKIVNKYLAWIVRAHDLSNYLMFQCGFDGINPHIRIGGDWIIYRHYDMPDKNMTFQSELSPDTWYKATIFCENRSIRTAIYKDNSAIFDRHWKIQPWVPVSLKDPSDPKGEKEKILVRRNIDFDFGSVGFRDFGDERGLIKNVYVEKL